MIFSRSSRTNGRHARQERQDRQDRARSRPGQSGARTLAEELGMPADYRDPAAADGAAGQSTGPDTPAPGAAEPEGPFDVSEAPEGVARLDLGSLQIPSVTGVQVRVQANQDGTVSRVVLVHGDSALQLAVFAAPRSEPIWDEVRAGIRKSLFTEGVAVEESDGPYGIELHARVRTQEGLKDLRFVGVDGPRWLVRADYQGPAAVDPAASPELSTCLRGLVVDRGVEARPTKEALPLRLSAKMAAQVQQQAAAGNGQAAPSLPATGQVADGQGATGQAARGPAASSPAASGPAAAGQGQTPRRRKPSPRPRPQRIEGVPDGDPAGGP